MKKFLITGNQRTGTTMMQMIASSFNESFVYPEEKNPFANLTPQEKRSKLLFRKCPQGQYIKQENRHLGDFVCGDSIKCISDVINNGWKIIYMIRDGRDVCVSKHGINPNIYWARSWQWISSHDNAKQYYNNPNVFTIKYESIVNNHDKIMNNLSKFVNADLKNYQMSYKSILKNPQAKLAVRKPRPIDNRSVNNWRNKEHAQRIKEIADDNFCRVLVELGYEKDKSWLEKI